jgi:tetratricopeptide (TPR) repeat protein
MVAVPALADDQIVKIDGTVLSGHIDGVTDGSVILEGRTSNGGTVKQPIPLTDVKSVTMAVPDGVTKAQVPNTAPADVIADLQAPVKMYAGLNATWVVDAMAQLGDAYAKLGQKDQALAIYSQIGTLYPNSAYTAVADASRAQVAIDANKVDDALKIVQPIVDKANQNLAPSAIDAETYARAFIVYGRALAAKGQAAGALEAFLTVKTMFYQNPAMVQEADRDAQDLRAKNPNIGVD